MKMIKVVVADDYPSIRYSNRQALQHVEDMEIVAECETADEVIPALVETNPDILLLDLSMPTKIGEEIEPIALIRQIGADHPNVKTIVISAFFVLTILEASLDSDIRGYIMKDDYDPEDLSSIIREVIAGHLYISKLVEELYNKENHRFPKLTDRDIEIIKALAKNLDLNVPQVATQLSITKQSLSNRLVEIYKEMEVGNKTHCIAKAQALGIIQPPTYRDIH